MSGAMRKMGVYLGLFEEADPELDELRADASQYDVEDTEQHQAREERAVANIADHRRTPRAATVATPMSRITTLHPRTYNEARVIGENFRDGVPVIMNLSEMSDADAKRLVDFAAGLVFAVRGSIERVTNKVFLLSPPNVSVTAEDKQRIAEGGFFNQS